jgi:hypothetical protein
MLPFSDTVNNTGIVQRARSLARVDANQWPTYKIANSANDWLDTVTGYAIGRDKRFNWDNTNHSKLPEGTTDLTINQSDYSFQTDEQGNPIVTLLGVSILQSADSTYYTPLTPVDRTDLGYDIATFGQVTGIPSEYDKIADNIVRFDTKPPATITNGIKFYFQRVSPRFEADDTTATTGFSPLLDRGFVVACAYDIALTLGLPNLQALALEQQKELQKMITYFGDRNNDTETIVSGESINSV